MLENKKQCSRGCKKGKDVRRKNIITQKQQMEENINDKRETNNRGAHQHQKLVF